MIRIDEKEKIVYLPYNTPQDIIDAWNKKGYHVQFEIV